MKRISFSSNLLFLSYLILGLSYISFVIQLAIKILPGFVMQILFLLEDISKDPQSLYGLISNQSFWTSIAGGVVIILLLFVIILGLIKSLTLLRKTNTFVKDIKTIRRYSENIYIMKADDFNVFSAGFIKPQIFLSENLYKILKKKQLQAILLHEDSHCRDYDSLRKYIILLINNILPISPFKNQFLKLYNSTVELKCDSHAEEMLREKKPLAEAILVMLKKGSINNVYTVTGFFENIPERIPVLVGSKKFNFKLVNTLVLAFVFISLSSLSFASFTKFYECSHVADCVKIFIQNLKDDSQVDVCNTSAAMVSNACNLQ